VKSVTVTGGAGAVSVPVGGPYTARMSGLTNGNSYRFTIQVCNTSDRCSTSAQSAAVVPFGAPTAPTISMNTSGRTVNISWGATNANGSSATTVSLSVSGAGASCPQPGLGGGSCSFQGDYATNYSATITAQNPAGSNARSASARTGDAPRPPAAISVSKGTSAQGQSGCSSSACKYIVINMSNFTPSTTYAVQLSNSYGPWGSGLSGIVNVMTDGNGNASKQSLYYFGWPGYTVTASTGGVSGTTQW